MGKWFCLNQGVEQTDSRWYMIQDADDYAYPWKLSVQMRAVKETRTLLNLDGFTPINADQKHITPVAPDLNNVQTIVGAEIQQCASISMKNAQIKHNYTGKYDLHNGATLFNRALHEVGFRFQPPHQGLRIALSEDSDYNLRATIQFHRTSWVPLPCYSYRLGTGHSQEHM